MPDRDLFAEGRAVDASIEPGPWRTEPSKYIQGRYVIAPDDRQIVHAAGIANRAQDAEAIVWMRNNLVALLDGLEAVERERDQAQMELADSKIETQQNYVAIAAKQQRDAARIAELEAEVGILKGLIDDRS